MAILSFRHPFLLENAKAGRDDMEHCGDVCLLCCYGFSEANVFMLKGIKWLVFIFGQAGKLSDFYTTESLVSLVLT